MTLARVTLRSTALFGALMGFLSTTGFGATAAQLPLIDQICEGIQSAPTCPAASVANAAEMTSWLIGLAKLGDVATLAAVMDRPQQFGIGQQDDILAGFCLVRDPKDRLLVLYGAAEHSRLPLIGFLKDTRAKSGPSDLGPAQAAANRKALVKQLQEMVLPGLCASARAAGASERTTAALAAVSLTRKLIAEAQAVEETRGNNETAEVNRDQFRKMVEDQLICEVKRETDFGGDCKFGGQIQSAILADVDLIAQKVRGLKQDIETSAAELDNHYGAWNAVERMLRTYAQVLSDRQQAGGDPDQLAFDEALRNLRSAFEDRQLLAQASGEASVWVNDNEPSRGTLACANAAANYPVCRTKGRDPQPLFSCPSEPITETNIEKWLICLHAEGMNSVRAAKDAGLPAGDLPRNVQQQFLDWLWGIDVIAATAADNVLNPRQAAK